MSSLKDNVFLLSSEEFKELKEAVDKRIDYELYGFTSYEEAALHYGRAPICPKCNSDKYHLDGYTKAGHIRYKCEICNCSYTLLSDSIFNSAKLPFHKLMNYLVLMSFNVPLNLLSEVVDISNNTAYVFLI